MKIAGLLVRGSSRTCLRMRATVEVVISASDVSAYLAPYGSSIHVYSSALIRNRHTRCRIPVHGCVPPKYASLASWSVCYPTCVSNGCLSRSALWSPIVHAVRLVRHNPDTTSPRICSMCSTTSSNSLQLFDRTTLFKQPIRRPRD